MRGSHPRRKREEKLRVRARLWLSLLGLVLAGVVHRGAVGYWNLPVFFLVFLMQLIVENRIPLHRLFAGRPAPCLVCNLPARVASMGREIDAGGLA